MSKIKNLDRDTLESDERPSLTLEDRSFSTNRNLILIEGKEQYPTFVNNEEVKEKHSVSKTSYNR